MLGDCFRIEKELSETLSEDGARRGEFLNWYVNGESERLARQHRKARFYGFLRHPRKPKLVGNNFGVWRSDFERVNGFDENFRGWGQEDDDLGLRLRRSGVRLDSILGWTRSYHLWHPRDPSTTAEWRAGVNVPYFLRARRLTRCRNGLVKRRNRRSGDSSRGATGRGRIVWTQLWRQFGTPHPTATMTNPEVELLFPAGRRKIQRPSGIANAGDPRRHAPQAAAASPSQSDRVGSPDRGD